VQAENQSQKSLLRVIRDLIRAICDETIARHPKLPTVGTKSFHHG
jgi:hypothetical protein